MINNSKIGIGKTNAISGLASAINRNNLPIHENQSPAARINNINILENIFPTTSHIQYPRTLNLQLDDLGKCLYDSTVINEANKSQFQNVCCKWECVKEHLIKCKKVLKCGHNCLGLENDDCNQFQCLDKTCKLYNKVYDQNQFSQCPICLENLQTFPIIKLPCNHYIHQRCFSKRLQMRWNTKDISFNYIKCPICNRLIESLNKFTRNKEVNDLFEEADKLYFTVNQIVEEKVLSEDKSDFDLDKHSFYICEKCCSPYYAGLRECREGGNNLIDHDEDESNKKLCLDCFDYSKIKGITNCDIHGRKHIQFKCKFCCNVSTHFCFGTTHFCEDCHLKQLKGDYLTKKDIKDLPKCEGEDNCPLKIKHPLNGEEFGICCLLCIN